MNSTMYNNSNLLHDNDTIELQKEEKPPEAKEVQCLLRTNRLLNEEMEEDPLKGTLFRLVKVPDPCDPDQIFHILNQSETFVAEPYNINIHQTYISGELCATVIMHQFKGF